MEKGNKSDNHQHIINRHVYGTEHRKPLLVNREHQMSMEHIHIMKGNVLIW